MELSEATLLAGTFVTSVLFKVHSLPISDRSAWAEQWWRERESRIPLRPALDEAQRHLRPFASRRIDKRRDRQVFLDISAIVDEDGQAGCPALVDGLCSIYDARPLSCRTVPLHYSRAPSTLQNYLDRFTATPGYRCDTTSASPVVVDGNKVVDPQISIDRDRSVALAKQERRWKERLIGVMNDPNLAVAAGLPTYDAVLSNSDNGYATMLPIITAWRVANQAGLFSVEELHELCRKQAGLIKTRIARNVTRPASKELLDLLAMYEFGLSKGGPDQLTPSREA
jgi:Fe-S-cluster containining protein